MDIELKHVKIENYKSIYQTEMNINDRITVIAGKNESGKTNVLKALEDFSKDNFDEESVPLGNEESNPNVELLFEYSGKYLNEIFKLKIFAEDENYTLTISRSQKVKDKVSGSIKENLKELLESEILFIVAENLNEFISVFNELKIENLDMKSGAIAIELANLISVYYDFQIFQKGYSAEECFNKFLDYLEIKPDIRNDAAIISLLENLLINRLNKVKNIVEDINKKMIIPNFIYFSSFDDKLPDEINYKKLSEQAYCNENKGFINLLNYLGIEVKDFISKMNGETRNVQNYLRGLSKDITGSFSNIYSQETIKLTLQKDNEKITINVFDKNDAEYAKKPSQRSQGFQWFLAFYLLLNSKNCKEDSIILIDEPGLYLHAKAQEDILEYFENSIANQIIYTTHSPFLIDSLNMHRVRLAINDRENMDGTQIINKYYASNDLETLTPLITAIGYNISKNPMDFGSGTNIITEGITDRYYLIAFMKLLGKNAENIHIIPSIGVSQIHYLVSILLGWKLDFKILIDTDKAGLDAEKDLKKYLLKHEDSERIIYVKEQKNERIESLFSEQDIKEEEVKANKTLIAFDFYKKVKNEEITLDNLQQETIDNFKDLFDRLGI